MGQDTVHSAKHDFISPLHVVVRPIKPEERARWNALIRQHHYLKSHRMGGESFRYIALLEGRWVALVGWSAAALKCRPRDSWIGWLPSVRYQRLKLVANNARFLILPDVHIPNLASRVLALSLKRLSSDWKAVYGHPILLAETFVDTSRFKGTCYKAAGWIPLGQTKGFTKSDRHYVHHGQPKTIFVRPLHKRAREWLKDPTPRPEFLQKVVNMKLSGKDTDKLLDCLRGLPDPRMRRGIRHGKLSILAVSICAVLCGARSFAAIAEWGKRCSQKTLKRLCCRFNDKSKRYEAPSEPTIRRLLQTIDAQAVDDGIGEWIDSLSSSRQEAIAIDGKTLKGARRKDGKKVHLLSALVHQQGTPIAQQEVAAKSNEIPSARPLLAPLDLEGKVVTADAMHTQKELVNFLVDKKRADYCLTVKDNQPQLKEDIESLGLNKTFPPSAPNDE